MDLKPRENLRYYVLKAEYCSLRYSLGIPEILHGFKTWGKSAKLRIESLIVWDTRIQRYMHELKTSGKSEILPFVQKFILWSTIQFVQGIRIQKPGQFTSTPHCKSYVSLLYKMNNIFYLVKMLSVIPQSMEEGRKEQTTQVVKITRKKIRRKRRERTTQLNQLKELIIQAIHIQNIPFPSHYLTFGTVLRNNWLSLN